METLNLVGDVTLNSSSRQQSPNIGVSFGSIKHTLHSRVGWSATLQQALMTLLETAVSKLDVHAADPAIRRRRRAI